MIDGLNWYHYVCDQKDRRRFLEDWITVHRAKTAKKDLITLNRVSDRNINHTQSYLARMDILGFPISDVEREKIWQSVVQGFEKSKPEQTAKASTENLAVVRTESIQDHMDRQVAEILGDIEDVLISIFTGEQQLGSSAQILNRAKLGVPHYKKLSARLEPLVAEFEELKVKRGKKSALSDHDQQLLEGYNWVSARNLKAGFNFLEDCLNTCRRLAVERQAARVRKKKPVDKSKLVRKFKYLAESKELKITSIKPVDCLNTSEVWVYNVRTRKLGVYRSEFPGSITIKGSQIIGINEATCVQKTLRKPLEQLAGFAKVHKNQTKKYFDGIRGTEVKLKPRSNEYLVILRAV